MTSKRKTLLKSLAAAALAVSYYGCSPAPNAAPAPAAESTAQESRRFERGLLWRIEAPATKPSYLLGTIHSDDPRVVKLPPEIQKHFDIAQSFSGELLLDTKAMVDMTTALFYTDERTLRGVVGEKLYAQTVAALRAHGLPTEGLDKQKPWVPAMMLSMPKPKADGVVLDHLLQQKAAAARKSVYGLETVAEQVGVFDKMSQADQIAILQYTIDDMQNRDAQLEELMRAYLARDLMTLMGLMDKYRPAANAGAYDKLMDRLLAQRNHRMVERMQARLKEGSAFIAIGAAHLAGPEGVLPLLERAGYRVSPVY